MVKALENIADRFELLTDRFSQELTRQEQFYERAENYFDEMKEKFFRDVIVQAVELEDKKNEQSKNGKTNGDRVAKYHG